VVALAVLFAAAPVRGQYLAVFVDGRLLRVREATLVGSDRIRLDLPVGGWLEVPLTRLERVIEDAPVAPQEEPVTPPACEPGWADQPLPEGTAFVEDIVSASRSADLHPWLVAAVVEAESRSNPRAVSRVGARGLMQLMPAVWRDEGVRDPFDPGANLRAGTRHLRRLLDRFGELPLALAAYNAGAATVERYGGVPPFRETRAYLRAVLGRFCPAGAGTAQAQ
jgi:soluble lytic murein transglycosylase-like protein